MSTKSKTSQAKTAAQRRVDVHEARDAALAALMVALQDANDTSETVEVVAEIRALTVVMQEDRS